MIKYCCTILFVCFSCLCLSQQLEFSGGYCYNQFYDFESDGTPEPGNGYLAGITVSGILIADSTIIDTVSIGFSLKLVNYSGTVSFSEMSPGGGSSLHMTTEKFVLELGFYPLDFKIYKQLRFALGIDVSYLIHSKEDIMDQFSSGYPPGIPNSEASKEIKYPKFYFGFSSRVSYKFNLNPDWYLVPDYTIYLGILPEFSDGPGNAGSMRHYFNFGLGRRF